jgi:CheY-like chemotaxis protein
MGGCISATSTVGAGTTFSFTIPLRATDEARLPAARGSEHRVLVVTDHGLGGEVLSEQLRSLGHVCRVAVGGVEARDALETVPGREAWTVLLVDQNHFDRAMPGIKDLLDGLPPLGRPRVILLNNLSSRHREDELSGLGFDGALSKPVRLSQLADLLDEPQRLADAAPVAPRPVPVAIDPDHNPERGPRILLAEDNPFNQKVAVAMLRLLGCSVDVAGTGVQAVDMARRQEYALVLMDCQMPVMDGYEATRRIRQLPGAAARTNIVAMTANALSGDRHACFDAGMDDFLSKPITRDMLRQMLLKWGIGAGTAAPSAEPATVPR